MIGGVEAGNGDAFAKLQAWTASIAPIRLSGTAYLIASPRDRVPVQPSPPRPPPAPFPDHLKSGCRALALGYSRMERPARSRGAGNRWHPALLDR